MKIIDYIEKQALKEIGACFDEACKKAEKTWDLLNAHEDSLTGGFLGQLVNASGDGWRIITRKYKSGRGNKEESVIGADGIIEININLPDRALKKSAIFQAKKKKYIGDLVNQIEKMKQAASGGNFVVIYSEDGYFAQKGEDHQIRKMPERRLSDFLVEEFLGCKTGIEGMDYDPIRKMLLYSTEIRLVVA